jgi:hypothetical protein
MQFKPLENAEQLYDRIDPSDGIPFRRPAIIADDIRRDYRPLSVRSIYRVGNGWRVMIRFHQVLYDLGRFPHFRLARDSRDRFYSIVYGPGWKAILGDRCGRRRRGDPNAPTTALARLQSAPSG